MNETASIATPASRFKFWRIRLSQRWHGTRRAVALAVVTRVLRWGARDSALVAHAARELGPVGGKDGPDLWMHHHLLAMVRLFCLEGHSGASASIGRGMLDRLLAFKPLGPLTGEDGEWSDQIGLDGDSRQNRRRSSVFLDKTSGVAYEIDGFVFREPPSGESRHNPCFTAWESRRIVRFPYTVPAEPLIVDVPEASTSEQRIEALRLAGVLDEEIWALQGGADG